MEDNITKRLTYRRQFILTQGEINCPFECKSFLIAEDYKLYYHPDLPFSKASNQQTELILLGDIFDYLEPGSSNQDILDALINKSYNELLRRISKMAGRFVLFYSDRKTFTALTDASAARKLFFTRIGDVTQCASTQHLLAEIAGADPSTDSSVLAYYQSNEFRKNFYANIGDTTLYPEIRQLLPNHYIDIRSLEIQRFWPSSILEPVSDEECVQECAAMIKGFLNAAAKRYSLMIPVSSGYDSRVVLAASKDVSEEVLYYLNDTEVVRSTADGWIPELICSEQKLNFHFLSIEDRADEDFKEVYFQNNKFANPEYLDIIYNYYKKHQEKLNLPGGIIPIVKALYHSSSQNVTGRDLAKLHGYDKFQFAIDFYDRWLTESEVPAKERGIAIYDLIFWEDRTCNWAMGIQQDKDIAQEDFLVFNSAYLISRMLTFNKTRRQSPYQELHKEIIKVLWPELLQYPFNPSTRNRIKQILISLKLYHFVQKTRRVLINP